MFVLSQLLATLFQASLSFTGDLRELHYRYYNPALRKTKGCPSRRPTISQSNQSQTHMEAILNAQDQGAAQRLLSLYEVLTKPVLHYKSVEDVTLISMHRDQSSNFLFSRPFSLDQVHGNSRHVRSC